MSDAHDPGGLGRGMPTYIVLDVSRSMAKYQALLNEALGKIIKELYLNPRISEFVHLSIVTFGSEPSVVVRMTELTRLRQMPTLSCRGETNFGPLFELLRDQIDIDVPVLEEKGYEVVRPVVLLLTDGAPTDRPSGAWREPLRGLTARDRRRRARTICFGFDDAVEEVLREMSTERTYIADPALGDSTSALTEAMSGMLNTMVSSAQARELSLPEEVAGHRTFSGQFTER